MPIARLRRNRSSITTTKPPEVQEYLRSRGLEHPELIDCFKLGFANRTLGYRLPEKNRKAGAELRCKLQDIRILGQSDHEQITSPTKKSAWI